MKNNKKDKDKLRYDLIPYGALDELARLLTVGAKKYGEFNWLEDSDRSDIRRYEAALGRHYSAHMQGEKMDAETGVPHIICVACNAFFIAELEKKEI